MLPKTKAILIVLFFISGSVVLFKIVPEEKEIAYNYYKQAAHFYSLNDYAQAEKLLNVALEFSPSFSDGWYLLARIYLQKADTLLQGLDYLKRGVLLDNWKFNKRTTAQKELAGILYRIKEYRQAEDVLLKLHNSSEVDAEIEIFFIKTLNALPEPNLLNKVITVALKRFPTEKELYILAAEYFYKHKSISDAMQIINVALNMNPGNTDFLFYKIKYTTNPVDEKKLLDQYLAEKGKRPEIAFTGLRLDKENSRQYIDFFMANRGNEQMDLLRTMIKTLEKDKELSDYFYSLEQEAVEKGSGRKKWLDTNQDGYYEAQLSFDQEGIKQLIIDNNQDGRAEAVVDFMAGKPVSFKQWNKDAYIAYVFSIYPYLESINYPGQELTSEYFIVPFTMKYPVMAKMADYQYEIDYTSQPVTEEQARKAAYRQILSKEQGKIPVKIKELHNGETTVEKTDTDEDGVFDFNLEYMNNLPVKASRDFDNDGLAEATEFYENGKLTRIEFDENRDGIVESVQYLMQTGTVTYWDYNFDGIYDARQRIQGKAVDYEFSTRYDNNFDLKIYMNDGKITGITRGNRTVPVSGDSQDNLYWIGKKGKLFNGITELTPGLHIRTGKSYFVFRHNNDIYIEDLQ